MQDGIRIMLYNWGHLGGKKANLGDKLMLELELYYLFRKITNAEKSNEILIDVFSSDPHYTKLRIKNIFKLLPNPKHISLEIHNFPTLNLYSFIELKNLLRTVDALIIGGGELIYDKSSYLYTLYNLYPALLFPKNNVFLFNAGFSTEPIARSTKWIINSIRKKLKFVYVRDPVSYTNTKKWFKIKRSNIIQGCDLGWLYRDLLERYTPPYNQSRNNKHAYHLITIFPRIPFALLRGYVINYIPYRLRRLLTRDTEKKILHQYYKIIELTISAILKYHKEDYKYPSIHIVASSTYTGIDDKVAEYLNKRLNEAFPNSETIIFRDLEPENVCNLLFKSKYVITSTFHSTILALLCNKKPITVSYSKKVDIIAREFNLPLINIENYTSLDLYSFMRKLAHLDETYYMANFQDKILKNINCAKSGTNTFFNALIAFLNFQHRRH